MEGYEMDEQTRSIMESQEYRDAVSGALLAAAEMYETEAVKSLLVGDETAYRQGLDMANELREAHDRREVRRTHTWTR
jgi:Flp pilus assembly protein TadB